MRMSEAKSLSSSCLLLSLLWALLQLGQAFPSTSDYLQRGWQRLLEEGEGCAECRPEECPAPRGCLAGTVRDACDCCWECANLEGQICDLDNTNHFYGKCGEHLECRLDAGDLQHGEVPEPQCACLSRLALCGSDGKTYAQICRFLEVARAHPDANLTVAHEGPCESGSAPGAALWAAGQRLVPLGKGQARGDHLAANPWCPQGHSSAGGCTIEWQVPPGHLTLLLWGSLCGSGTWRGLGAALPNGSRVYGKQQILLEQMGKFQGIVSEFLAAVLGSRWPGAPEKCGCLLQKETWVDLTWLRNFHFPGRGLGGQAAVGIPSPSLPSPHRLPSAVTTARGPSRLTLFSVDRHVLDFIFGGGGLPLTSGSCYGPDPGAGVGRKGGPHSITLGKGCGTWRYLRRTASGELLTPLIAGTSPVPEQRPRSAGRSSTSSIPTSLMLEESSSAFVPQEERALIVQESFAL